MVTPVLQMEKARLRDSLRRAAPEFVIAPDKIVMCGAHTPRSAGVVAGGQSVWALLRLRVCPYR
jgi:hypothetical protein